MKFTTVTLGYEEVEWINPDDEIKKAIWDDKDYAEWLAGRDLMAALESVSYFHRTVANQLRRRGVYSDWGRSALGLTIQLRKRRSELRHAVMLTYGSERLATFKRVFDAMHPRAEVCRKAQIPPEGYEAKA